MSLPSSIRNLFSQNYEGFPAARFTRSIEAKNLEATLREAGMSYRTKIHNKKKNAQYIVMLVESA
jgi:hypothetical protein